LAKLKGQTDEAIHTLIRSRFSSHPFTWTWLALNHIGQRLSSEKGQSDDLVGAMKAQERLRHDAEALSDDEE
jgi:hypothetical protein